MSHQTSNINRTHVCSAMPEHRKQQKELFSVTFVFIPGTRSRLQCLEWSVSRNQPKNNFLCASTPAINKKKSLPTKIELPYAQTNFICIANSFRTQLSDSDSELCFLERKERKFDSSISVISYLFQP